MHSAFTTSNSGPITERDRFTLETLAKLAPQPSSMYQCWVGVGQTQSFFESFQRSVPTSVPEGARTKLGAVLPLRGIPVSENAYVPAKRGFVVSMTTDNAFGIPTPIVTHVLDWEDGVLKVC